ncbi:DUF1648 domain-containing protein [Heyndrickxia oleronia]|uniref:DUF1648 domain-containing protein n=2 Tax=Heyndrickxia oleronia TaxID=38875 RepID=UPI0024300674|nr:DUF5808 domain-containing protein [Heyndrickxia oleronia]MCI1593105.1 DUF5808 domain-containing protein [Heyndrickxia oleronia]MCI1613619.1 DUF5808 domain-containing protein [Heyndrickxia oleronia]MCI1761383.1 DUF5808 domain-containing protein [Heyndrickxia oleronia]
MLISVFLILMLFIIAIQTALPYLVKRTVVFGVTIPDQYITNLTLSSYKRRYSRTVFLLSVIAILIYTFWVLKGEASEEFLVLTGLAIQFGVIVISMSLYFYFHAKTIQLKKSKKWGENVKQVRITDIAVRSQDEMLPWYIYIIPMVVTLGVIGYTLIQYKHLPQQIPMHWGPDGKPDSFTEKNPFSVHILSLILLVMQFMFLGINEMTKKSGIKLSATSTDASRIRQLTLRKYSSWFLFIVSILISMLFAFLQLTTIHTGLMSDAYVMFFPFIFLILILIGTVIFSVKVGKSDNQLNISPIEGIVDMDDDQYWKGGLFYFNKNDPSIFVEKRFGVGWTMNFANPIGYLCIFGPIILILVLTFFA